MKDYNEMAESLFRRREKYMTEKRQKRTVLIKTSASLCCLCLAVLSGLWILNNNPVRDADLPFDVTPVAIEKAMGGPQAADADHTGGNGISDLQNDLSLPKDTEDPPISTESSGHPGPYRQNAETSDSKAPDENTESEPGNSDSEAPYENAGDGSQDAPVSEQSPGSLQHLTAPGGTADFFGGSYTDSQGFLCILLTEDTPENRSAICRELNLTESNTLFQKADYTLSYLTDLQAMISAGMISRELNFVIVSSLREDTNRIHLTVTTDDPSQLEKLKALDSLGGALEIEYQPGGGAMSRELLIDKKSVSP